MREGQHSPLNVQEAQELAESNPRTRFIDVRTAGEFAAEHIPGSYNVPLDLLREHSRQLRAAHDDPLVLVCASGGRADQAQRSLHEAGFDQLGVLAGGINEWHQHGGALNTGSGAWAMERQVRLAAGSMALLSILAGLRFRPARWISAAIGGGLVFSAVTNTCGMARVLAKLPHNRTRSCDPNSALSALTAASPPVAAGLTHAKD